MTNECLPKMGKIVIIDDKDTEGFPLLSTLSNQGFAVKYFTGRENGIPAVPLNDIRLIFLDVVLDDNDKDEKSTISTLDRVFKQIVDTKNIGPYILVGWTKQTDLFKKFVSENLKECPPVVCTCLNKPEYQIPGKSGDPVKYDLPKINLKIDQEFEKIGIFKNLLIWENIVHDSSEEILRMLNTNEGRKEDYWNNTVPLIFFNLAKENLGSTLIADEGKYQKNLVVHSLMVFNHTFLDCIETNIQKKPAYPKIEIKFSKKMVDDFLVTCNISREKLKTFPYGNFFDIINPDCFIPKFNYYDLINGSEILEPGQKKRLQLLLKLDEKIAAQLNAKLHFILNVSPSPASPGDIYFIKTDDVLIKTLNDLFTPDALKTQSTIIESFKQIFCEISPQCDCVQDKWRCHRILPGILCPDEHENFLNSGDFVYKSPPFWIDGGIKRMVFNINNLQSVKFDFINDHVKLGQLRNDLLIQIQSKVASHVQRVGIVALNHSGDKH